jgi:hypothetical protein
MMMQSALTSAGIASDAMLAYVSRRSAERFCVGIAIVSLTVYAMVRARRANWMPL